MALPCRAMDDIEAVFVTGTEIERELHEIAENLQRIDGAGAGNANRAIPRVKVRQSTKEIGVERDDARRPSFATTGLICPR